MVGGHLKVQSRKSYDKCKVFQKDCKRCKNVYIDLMCVVKPNIENEVILMELMECFC